MAWSMQMSESLSSNDCLTDTLSTRTRAVSLSPTHICINDVLVGQLTFSTWRRYILHAPQPNLSSHYLQLGNSESQPTPQFQSAIFGDVRNAFPEGFYRSNILLRSFAAPLSPSPAVNSRMLRACLVVMPSMVLQECGNRRYGTSQPCVLTQILFERLLKSSSLRFTGAAGWSVRRLPPLAQRHSGMVSLCHH